MNQEKSAIQYEKENAVRGNSFYFVIDFLMTAVAEVSDQPHVKRTDRQDYERQTKCKNRTRYEANETTPRQRLPIVTTRLRIVSTRPGDSQKEPLG